MSRTLGSKSRHPTVDARITVRLPKKLLDQLDQIVTHTYHYNRSEVVLQALVDYVQYHQKEGII